MTRDVPNRTLSLTVAWLAAFACPAKVKPSEWIENNLVLPAEASSVSGKIKLYTYQSGMVDAIAEPGIETAVYQISVQTGKSTVLDGALSYNIATAPGPMLLVHPTDKQGAKYVNDRLKPTIKGTLALRSIITAGKGGSDFTGAYIKFPGGNLRVASAHRPDDLRSRANKLLLLDEVDAYPKSSGGKGEPIKLASDRNITYRGNGGLTLIASTPAEREGSRIEQHLYRGDVRRFFVKWPCCGASDYFRFDDHLKWEKNKPETAYLACSHCGVIHDEAARRRMIAGGRWKATQVGEKGVASFHASILISEVNGVTLEFIARQAEAAKTTAERMAFRNSYLAETFCPTEAEQLDADRLYERRVAIEPPYPKEIEYITCGCDVQANRIEVLWLGICKAGVLYVLDAIKIMGDTSAPVPTGVWLKLDEAFARTFTIKSGEKLAPSAYAVDSGYLQEIVAQFVAWQRSKQRNAFATKGAKAWDAPPWRLGAKLYGITTQMQIGTVALKKTLLSRLAMKEPGPGWIHLPAHLEFDTVQQLTSEVIVTEYVRGQPRDHVQPITGIRNEALDMLCYAFALTFIPGITRRVVTTTAPAINRAEDQAKALEAYRATMQNIGSNPI